jgi:hypothetical protein
MIQAITGKPGDGKTLFAVSRILEELITSERFIVTNIPLHPERVHEFVTIERKRRGLADYPYPYEDQLTVEWGFNFDSRVKVIGDEDVMEFFRVRADGLKLAASPDMLVERTSERLDRLPFIAAMKSNFALMKQVSKARRRPVSYYIDEAHNYFSSREWTQTGRGLLYYASQHRHLHDEIYLITQVLENVETQLRRLISETHVVKNQLRRRIGPWRCRPGFRVSHYYGTFTGGPGAKAYDSTFFRLDPAGVAGCYQTVGALGVHTTPEAIKVKGLPWWTMFVAGGLVVAAVAFFIGGLPLIGADYVAKKVVGDAEKQAKRVGAAAVASPAPGAQHRQSVIPGLGAVDGAGVSREKEPPKPPFVQAAFLPPFPVIVYVSDGRRLRDEDLSVILPGRHVVTTAGERIQWGATR